jgi:hypothetical protein
MEVVMSIPPAGIPQPTTVVYSNGNPVQPEANCADPPQAEVALPQLQAVQLRVSVKFS